jgi:uncharacterized coiled-coil protein SlyX
MTHSEKKSEGEVTLDDLARMVAGGFSEMRQEMHAGFEHVNGRVDRLEAKMDQKFSEVDDRLLNLERKTSEMHTTLLDMRDDLAATDTSNELNSRQLISHESRITALEAAAA